MATKTDECLLVRRAAYDIICTTTATNCCSYFYIDDMEEIGDTH